MPTNETMGKIAAVLSVNAAALGVSLADGVLLGFKIFSLGVGGLYTVWRWYTDAKDRKNKQQNPKP